MSLLTVTNLSKSYGADQLFAGITFSLAAGQKLGLIGRNGGGKTTLLRMLLGTERPDVLLNAVPAPKISLAAGRRMGYLKQEAPVHPEHTIAQEIEEALAPLRQLEAQLAAAEHAMSDATDDDALEKAMAEYTAVHDAFEARGGYAMEAESSLILQRLGFGPESREKTVGSCSGGEQTRLALAKLFLTRPDLLILDEPTNHLDILSCETLTQILQSYDGTLLLVSHDRYLLNAVTDKTLAVTGDGTITLFEGNYAAWRESLNPPVVTTPTPKNVAPPAPTGNARERSKARTRADEAVARAEKDVQEKEARLAELEALLSSGDPSQDLVAVAADYTRVQTEVEAALAAWESAVAEREALE